MRIQHNIAALNSYRNLTGNNNAVSKNLEKLSSGYIMELLQKLKKENQLSFLFICHDLALVQLFCDRVIVMHDGHVEEEGTPEEIIEHPRTEYTEQLIRSVL